MEVPDYRLIARPPYFPFRNLIADCSKEGKEAGRKVRAA